MTLLTGEADDATVDGRHDDARPGLLGRLRRRPTGAATLPPGVRSVAVHHGLTPMRAGVNIPRRRGTTAHVASIYPFHGGHALSSTDGPYVGINVTDGGSSWHYDPFELYRKHLGASDTLTNSSTLVLGEPGNGKSAYPKVTIARELGYYGDRRFAAISDPKGEYGLLAETLGLLRTRLRPGGTERLNPLDPGPGDPDLSLLLRQTLMAAMYGLVLRRDLTSIEEALLSIAIQRLDSSQRGHPAPTLIDLSRMLGELPAEVTKRDELSLLSQEELNGALTSLRVALTKLLQHTLRGIFDGPSTLKVQWNSARGVVVDLSSVFGNSEALPLVQLTTNAWLQSQIADLQNQGRRGILVEDEVWATAGSERSAKAMQARLKLCRLYGIWNILITHRLSDLRAQADDGSSAAKVATDMLGDIQTRIVFRQATDQIEETGRRLQLNRRQQELLTRLPPHRALWIVAGRKAVVHHVVADHELALTDTDGAMGA